ncbi:phosphate acetyltransferase [Pontiella sulfatireligans]|uniref:Phosphate acetyltransferase n=1 Tax=Pontiella sulfatireligans TaxID=2750658 RepID=A0A6C2UJX6_9BACT|nr:phosphate acetyltransferase [Pontiella sulfatireligans]VGO20525.1 Phosphate acetyltransferase [Pontiella sulfatireligans]
MGRSLFIQQIIDSAKLKQRSIVLPEGNDERVREAANTINQEGIATITLLGSEQAITEAFSSKGWSLEGITVIDPETSGKLQEYADAFYELRKAKGIKPEQALEAVKQANYFGMMIVQAGEADGLVSGAVHSTADTVRPALQIIKAAKRGATVSSFFLECVNDVPYIFSDCGLVEDPDADQLSQIAVQSANSAIQFGIPPMTAMLSYSTYGSASSPLVEKVQEATKLAKQRVADECPGKGIIVDGELQLDAAIVPEVAAKKAPESPLGGEARVLIFPDLNAGNISYKIVERMAGAEAFGPLLQGLNKPVNDLSRGCSVEDIVGVAAITVLQAF